MTEKSGASVPHYNKSAEHLPLPNDNDAYESLHMLTVLSTLGPSPPRCWQMHRCLTVSVPLLRAWIHCPRAPEQFVTSPLCLVGYVRWDARSDPPSRQSFK